MPNPPEFLDPRLTERRNPQTVDIDVATSQTIVDLMFEEDRRVPEAVHAQREPIAATIDRVVAAFEAGGRLLYVGAGTSGRLGVLDATECPPTFGTPREMVVGVIAGGREALVRSMEGAEDDRDAGRAAMDAHEVNDRDFVLGIAASGTTPYVAAAVLRAQERGAGTGIFTCATPPPELTSRCDVVIAVRAGPEVLTGSTRLKAGTATKLVLNMITTGAMVRMGKAYGNLMVDLMAMSDKLVDRGERVVMEAAGVSRPAARAAIAAADGSVKLAVVMAKTGIDVAEARRRLGDAGGNVRRAVGDPPPVVADGGGSH